MDWSTHTILVTGATGSFGRRFVATLVRDQRPRKVIVFSRDELKQHEMRAVDGFEDPSLRWFIGDVRDVERLKRAMRGVDIVVHAAALKQITTCEYNPNEAILTNVIGTRNVIDAALENGVQRVLALSTDKAVNPVNLYGATKLCAEKLVIQSNAYAGGRDSRFSCVRYGNVVGSRGSVVPLFREQKRTGKVTVTDPRMTRFWITLDQGVALVLRALEDMRGGEVFVPKIPSMRIMDLVEALAPGCAVETIGIRAGEKLHEVLISEDEARSTLERSDHYVIEPAHPWWQSRWSDGGRVPEGFRYSSDTNTAWLSTSDLRCMAGESTAESA